MAILILLISLVSHGEPKMPPIESIKQVSLCHHSAIPRCYYLVHDGDKYSEKRRADKQSDTTITAAQFKEMFLAMVKKIKKTKNPKSPCSPHVRFNIMVGAEEASEKLCSEDYTSQEWEAWAEYLR